MTNDEDEVFFLKSTDEFRLLRELVDEQHETDVDHVLRHVNGVVAETQLIGKPSSCVCNIFLSVLELAQRLEPARHHKLVEFMARLQGQGVLSHPDTGQPVQDEGGVYWRDLPHWDYIETDEHEQCGAADPREAKNSVDPTMSPAHRLRFANLHALYAQLTEATWTDICDGTTEPASWCDRRKTTLPYPLPPAVSRFTVTPLDMSMRAIWTLCVALEEDEDVDDEAIMQSGGLLGLPHPMALDDTYEIITDVPTPTTAAAWAAYAWFTHAPRRLWAHVRAGLVYSEESFAGRLSAKYRGFERDRWDAWEARLTEWEGECVDGESKARLQCALANMRRVREEDSE